ncbi:MAG: gluconeogenesis factor YvcK family protein [Alkaliphilus sp.]
MKFYGYTKLKKTMRKIFKGSDKKLSKPQSKTIKQIFSKYNPKIVAIGGGTGLSVLLRGLKQLTPNITAIVTVADDGGGSGRLREDLGMLPPGDIRSCILALAEMEPTMEKLFQYRFTEGSLKGQNFGNLFIASMNGISENFEEAVKKVSEVLAVTGKVVPVSLENITLYAKLENGSVIKGESNIPIKSLEQQSPIDRVFIKPRESKAVKEAIAAIKEADLIVLGPGSLYTSIIPNILINSIARALIDTKATKVYIPNIMTQPGETDGYSVSKHVEGIIKHCKNISIDYIVVNSKKLSEKTVEKYKLEGAKLVTLNKSGREKLEKLNISIIEEELVEVKKDYIRHDTVKLARILMSLVGKRK